MTSVFVEADIQLVDLNLANASNGCPEVILQAIGRETEESIDEPVVTHDRQKRLFVVQRVSPDQFRRGVRHGDADQVFARLDACRPYELESIAGAPSPLDDPFQSFRLGPDDGVRQSDPITE